MIRFKRVPLLKIIRDSGEYYYKAAIISIGIVPWMFKEREDQSGVDCVQFKYLGYINLWFLEVGWEFLGRNKAK